MIKIKTKKTNNKFIVEEYEIKNSGLFEHIALITFLIYLVIEKNKEIGIGMSFDNLLEILKEYDKRKDKTVK